MKYVVSFVYEAGGDSYVEASSKKEAEQKFRATWRGYASDKDWVEILCQEKMHITVQSEDENPELLEEVLKEMEE